MSGSLHVHIGLKERGGGYDGGGGGLNYASWLVSQD